MEISLKSYINIGMKIFIKKFKNPFSIIFSFT